MPRSPLNLTRHAARALAATCALVLGGLALSSAARAETPCPDGARCGSVTVPLDRANPSAGTIDIAYALLSRTDTSRPALGTIVPNPGGPGQSTIGSAGLYTGALALLRTRRDLLLIDPRGTGRSGALSCPSLAAHDPLTLEYADLTRICGADLGARAGLYGSAAVADDIERLQALTYLSFDPTLISFAGQVATACHDYPRPFSLADAPADRRAAYYCALAALDSAQFKPFSADAWLSTDIEAGPKCLDSPADASAGSPLQNLPMPDVPVLVQSGDLDSNTPVEQGRQAAAQFAHPIYGIVANAGHTPDKDPCGVAMAIDFIEHLTTDPNRCLHAGRPPAVVERPAMHAAQLPHSPIRTAGPVRRAVAVALATIADARTAATYSGMTGPLDALRGGSYMVSQHRVRFMDARVVTDATANGTLKIGRRATRTRLRLRGHGVPPAQLTLISTATTTRVTGTVAGRRVALRIGSTH